MLFRSAGHRLRLEVSSSLFPNYARNLNTAADPYTSTAIRVAHNQVWHGGNRLSRLVLPVAPGSSSNPANRANPANPAVTPSAPGR